MKPAQGWRYWSRDLNSPGLRPPKGQPLIPFCELTYPHFTFLVFGNLVFSAEKYLKQEPGTQPYNGSEDSVPEHKIALLKA